MRAVAAWDRRAGSWARRRAHHPTGDVLLSRASQAAEHARLWLACSAAGALLDRDRRGAWLRAAVAVAAAETVSQRLKRVVRRARPALEGLPPLAATPSEYSFPSAHTASSVTAARAFPRGGPWLAGIALAMGLSRPYLGVHYPSDVIAGAGIGWVAGALARRPATRPRHWRPGRRRR